MRPQDDERHLAHRRIAVVLFMALLSGLVVMPATWPIGYILTHKPAPAQFIETVRVYGNMLLHEPAEIKRIYVNWYRAEMRQTGRPPLIWVIAPGAAALVLIFGLALNPYSTQRTDHGSARVATPADVRRRKLLGRTGIPLGQMEGTPLQEWIKGSFIGKSDLRELPPHLAWCRPVIVGLSDWAFSTPLIRNWETLSCRTLAPPGTGKTVQLVSNILADWPDPGKKRDGRWKSPPCPCMIVNDPKGEIFKTTAGWRSTLGPVFRFDWGNPAVSNCWNPISPMAYPGGEDLVQVRRDILETLGRLYSAPGSALSRILTAQRDEGPDWLDYVIANPTRGGELELLDEEDRAGIKETLEGVSEPVLRLQARMADREKHLDRMRAVLVPDNIETHWREAGREFLSGAMGYSMARADRLGYEPTMGQLLDDLAGMSRDGGFKELDEQADAVKELDPKELEEQDPPMGEDGVDLSAIMIDEWLKECREYGYPDRVILDLASARKKPDRERGSVISTAGASINIFKAATVRAVTSSCDIRLSEIRGIEGRPVTAYVTVPLEDAEALGRVTGLFLEAQAAFCLSQEKGDIEKQRPVFIMADEFWTLPALEALLQIPAFGRGQWVSLEIVGQSRGQIGMKYRAKGGENAVQTIEGSMSYFRDLTQTDFTSAKAISDSVGNTTIRQESQGRQVGIGNPFSSQAQSKDLFERNLNVSYTGRQLFPPDKIMSMEKLDPAKGEWGYQLIRTTAMGMNRPIVCRPCPWFKHPVMRHRGGMPVDQQESGRTQVSAAGGAA